MRVMVALGGASLAAVGIWHALSPDPNVSAGKALFNGDVPLKARMVGHDTELPPVAVRCANCHSRAVTAPLAPTTPPRPAASAAPGDIYAAPLTRAALVEPRPRRGGPASRYDVAGFCRVLREGIDPAHVMIVQTMPRYSVSDEECQKLWSFVTHE